MTSARSARDGESAESAGPRFVSGPDGHSVAYTTYGVPDGRAVLFFHGTPGSRMLGQLFDEPAREHGIRLVAIDRPGYGRSTPRPERSPTDVAKSVDAVLADVGVSRAGIVAFSGGSPYAYAVANESRATIDSIDVIAGAVPPSLQSESPAIVRLLGSLATHAPRLLGALVRTQARIATHGPPSIVTGQYTSDGAATEVPREDAEVVKRDFLEAVGGGATGLVTESRHRSQQWDGFVEDVSVPVRLRHGDHDTNVPIAGPRRLAGLLPSARLVEYDGADHLGTLLQARGPALARQSEENS